MNNKIPQIKEELERRYKMCSGTTFWGFLEFAQYYLDLVKKIPLLQEILDKAANGLKQCEYNSKNKFEIMLPVYYKGFSQKIERILEDTEHPITKWPSRHYENGFRQSIKFIHDQLIGKLSESEIENLDDNTTDVNKLDNYQWSYNKENKIFSIGKYSFKITKKRTITKRSLFFDYLMENDFYNNNCFYDIAEEAFGDHTERSNKWRQCYTACEGINEIIFKNTEHTIVDFLFYTTGKDGYVKINSKYNHAI
jgi:hypothetical protein